jgi:hypothetical protein
MGLVVGESRTPDHTAGNRTTVPEEVKSRGESTSEGRKHASVYHRTRGNTDSASMKHMITRRARAATRKTRPKNKFNIVHKGPLSISSKTHATSIQQPHL